MKITGIIRKLDELGRIVIPAEYRRHLNVSVDDEFEVLCVGDEIILRKHINCDMFTGETENLVEYQGKFLSVNTIHKLTALAKKAMKNR